MTKHTTDIHPPLRPSALSAPLRFNWNARSRSPRERRGLILIVVLVMVVLLSLLAAGYTFLVRAELDSTRAVVNEFQVTKAAESGVQRAIHELRLNMGDPQKWYDNPESFRGGVVCAVAGDQSGVSTQRRLTDTDSVLESDKKEQEKQAGEDMDQLYYRFNLVGTNFDEPDRVRYGLTDECSKLDINRADARRLRRLFDAALEDQKAITAETEPVNIDVLVESLLDWRENGTAARPNGAKDEWYMTNRKPGYRCKRAPFETVDELLLVRGFTAQVLYGEDTNRNGLLDANEDDGDESPPHDNEDGALDRGLSPYLTVWARDTNADSLNKPRIDINLPDVAELERRLAEAEGLPAHITDFILQQRSAGRRFNSLLDLIDIPQEEVEEEGDPLDEEEPATQPTDPEALQERLDAEQEQMNQEGLRRNEELHRQAQEGALDGQPGDQQTDESGQNPDTTGGRRGGGRQNTDGGGRGGGRRGAAGADGGNTKGGGNRKQVVPDAEQQEEQEQQEEPRQPRGRRGGGRRGGAQQTPTDEEQPAVGDGEIEDDQELNTGRPTTPTNENGDEQQPRNTGRRGQQQGPPPPGTIDDLPAVLDRLAADPGFARPWYDGRINVNTAPRPVLLSLAELSEEQVDQLIAVRQGLDAEQKRTVAWLATEGVVSPARFKAVYPKITSKSSRFAVESVGYADHIDTVKRLYVILEMRGPIGQVLYYRDLTPLGPAYHPREEETRALTDKGS